MLKKSMVALTIAVGAVLPVVAPAYAHHSVGAFYTEDTKDVSGKLIEFLYVNPHGQLVIQDAEGAYWIGEMGSVLGLRRQGLTPSTLPIGTDLSIHARTSRDGTNRLYVEAIQVDGKYVYGADPSENADNKAAPAADAAAPAAPAI